MQIQINLPDKIDKDEYLGRMITGGNSRRNFKKYFDIDRSAPENFIIKPSVFLDDRTPMIFSVNRINTLTEEETHLIGRHHQETKNTSAYNGYAKIKAEVCYNNKCNIIKDDVKGTNPYHANVIYPSDIQTKKDVLLIAAELIFKAELILVKDFIELLH